MGVLLPLGLNTPLHRVICCPLSGDLELGALLHPSRRSIRPRRDLLCPLGHLQPSLLIGPPFLLFLFAAVAAAASTRPVAAAAATSKQQQLLEHLSPSSRRLSPSGPRGVQFPRGPLCHYNVASRSSSRSGGARPPCVSSCLWGREPGPFSLQHIFWWRDTCVRCSKSFLWGILAAAYWGPLGAPR